MKTPIIVENVTWEEAKEIAIKHGMEMKSNNEMSTLKDISIIPSGVVFWNITSRGPEDAWVSERKLRMGHDSIAIYESPRTEKHSVILF
jgi:hypothetical protein